MVTTKDISVLERETHSVRSLDTSKPLTVIGGGQAVFYLIKNLRSHGVDVTTLLTSSPLEGTLRGVDIKKFLTDNELSQHLSVDSNQYFLVAFYDRKIPPSLVDQYQGRLFNFHPSLLPFFRGPNPAEDMVKAGITLGGVTIHQVDQDYDAGDIFGQTSFQFHPGIGSKRKVDLYYQEACQQGAKLMAQVLTNFDKISPVPQTQLGKDVGQMKRLLQYGIADHRFHRD